jgi:murein DD-endopeptidase MepM/ murein hydrolase activator NlpD
MANAYGTSSAQLQEVLRAQAMLEHARNRPTQASQRGGVSSTSDMTDYFKGELEAQRQSRVGRQVQKYTMFPGMALGTAARYSKEIGLEQKIKALASMMSKAGGKGADTDAIVDAITKVGGLGYMASVAPLNVMRQKRLAYERGLKPQLGKVGTASSALDTLSMANRMMITPRVLSMIYGGGMPSSLQSSMGLYGAGIPMAKGIAGMMGAKLPAAMAGGMGGAVTGALPFMAAQMGLSMWKQKKVAAITAQRKAGNTEEAKFSLSKGLDSQISMLAQKGLIQPGEQIRIQLLKWIESHTSVLPEMWSEQQYIREEKEKGFKGAGRAYRKGLGESEDLGLIGGIVDKAEGVMSKGLAKYDIFGQIFNFITTGKLPKQFQDELDTAYSRLSGEEKRESKRTARERGVSLAQSRLLEMTSSQLIDMAGSHESKMITILGAQFDVQRFFASEIMTIRKVGFGIPDNLVKDNDFEQSGLGKLMDIIKAPFSAINNIPGLNAVFNAVRGVAGIPGAMRRGASAIWGGARNFMLGGQETTRLLSSEEELRKEAGVHKSDQQMAYEYVGRGLPDIMEEMRFLGAVRAQLLTNIYHVLSAQLEATTGGRVSYDDKPFSQMTKKGVWSYTAGKYLDEKGLKDQQKQDQERMEIALEKSFRGSGMDRIGYLIDMITGKKRGKLGAQQRLTEASERVAKFETLPYRLLQGKEGEGRLKRMGKLFGASILEDVGQQEFVYSPKELIEAARFRQREMRGRSRAKVVPGWLGAEQERAQMAMQQDIMPKVMRSLGIAAGGATSVLGMGTLGLAASLATGGSLLPIILALTAGATTGVIPQTTAELKAAQDLFEGINLNIEDIRKISLGYADMPSGVKTSREQRGRVMKYYETVNPKFASQIEKDPDSFFNNVNNFPYVMMALQGDTTLGFMKTAQKSGVPLNAESFKALGGDMPKDDYKTMNDLYMALTTRERPVPVEIVKIGKELGESVPMYLKSPAKALRVIQGGKKPDETNDAPKGAKVFEFMRKNAREKKVSEFEREFAEAAGFSQYQTGGDVKRTGLAFLHKGETVIPPGGSRDLKQELKEVEAKKWEDKVFDVWEKMLDKLEEIDENTEGVNDKGKGEKSGKKKEGAGMFGGLFSSLASGIGSMFTGILGAITGGLGIRGLFKLGAKNTGKGIWSALKWGGKGVGNIASKFGAGFMESGTGQAISNKLFDLRFGARGLAKQFAPGRLLGKGLAGTRDLLGRIPGLGRAGEFLGKAGTRGMSLLGRTPGSLGAGAGKFLGTMGRGITRLGGVGMSALMGLGGTAYGAMKAQERYGDVIGEDLSILQKIGLGANTGIKAMTFGLLDIEKLTGAKAAREGVIKSKERAQKIADSFQAKISRYCSPKAFQIVAAAAKNMPWSDAFMSVKGKEIFPGGPHSKYKWIVKGEEVEINVKVEGADVGKPKTGIEWHSLLVNACEQYIAYQEKGNIEGMRKAGIEIHRWVPDKKVKEVIELYKRTGKEQKITPLGSKKKPGDNISAIVTQEIKKAHSAMMGPAGLAMAQSQAGINYSPETEPTRQLSDWQRVTESISREGGIFGAINSALSNMGSEVSGWTSGAANKLGSGALVWPGSDYITSPFGPRNPSLPGASKMHRGVDMRADQVVAAADGTVVDINSDWGGVTIDHGNGVSTRYLHMDSSSVKKGDKVTAGQKIGMAGTKSAGQIPGMRKHLHFEVMRDGRKLDPELVYNQAAQFSPKYAPDIDPNRQLTAKLGHKMVDPTALKAEGAESAGPFGFDSYDPIELRGSLSKKIDDIQKENKRKNMVQDYKTSSAPMMVPIPVNVGSDVNKSQYFKDKKMMEIDPSLDSFIEELFCDASYEFGQRYKKYAYHSNVGHSFI